MPYSSFNLPSLPNSSSSLTTPPSHPSTGERGGSVVECRTPEREVRGSRPTVAVLCPWARHFTPRKYWLITQEAMAPSRHDWKIVDWDVKPQHNQPIILQLIQFTQLILQLIQLTQIILQLIQLNQLILQLNNSSNSSSSLTTHPAHSSIHPTYPTHPSTHPTYPTHP